MANIQKLFSYLKVRSGPRQIETKRATEFFANLSLRACATYPNIESCAKVCSQIRAKIPNARKLIRAKLIKLLALELEDGERMSYLVGGGISKLSLEKRNLMQQLD